MIVFFNKNPSLSDIYTPVLLGKTHFSLELTDHEARLLRVNRFGKGFCVEAAGCIPRSDENGLRDALADWGGSRRKGGNKARIGIHPKSAYFSLTLLDSARSTRAADALWGDFKEQLHLEDVSYENHILSPRSGRAYRPNLEEREWLFAGAKSVALRDYKERFELAGLVVERQELAVLATVGGLIDMMRLLEMPASLLTIFLGTDNSIALVTTKEGLKMVRALPVGLRSLAAAYAQAATGVDEASASQLLLTLASAPSDAALSAAIGERLQREIETFAGFYELQTGHSIQGLSIIPSVHTLIWIEGLVAKALGVTLFRPSYTKWLESMGASWDSSVDLQAHGSIWTPTLSLLAHYNHGSIATTF